MRAAVVVLGIACITLGACRSTSNSPYGTPPETARNPLAAQELNAEAAELIESDPDRAEQLLREALTADIYFGPAHNNLGVIHLNRGKLYEAAQEFEWARKLMPGHPDPRVNLALALEGAGQIDGAFAAFEAALEVYPSYLPAMQGMVSLARRSGTRYEIPRAHLEEIASRAEPGPWRTWALGELAKGER